MFPSAIPRADRDFHIQDYIPGQSIPPLIRDPHTGKIVVNELKRYVKPYTLSIEPFEVTLAADEVSDPIILPLDGKGHFEIVRAHFKSEQPEGFTVEIFDPGGLQSERPNLMNREVHVATIAAGGPTDFAPAAVINGGSSPGRPFVWPETFWMNVDEGTKALFVRFRNLSGLSNRVRFAFHGNRWYHTLAPTPIADRMIEIYRRRFRTMPYFFTTDGIVELAALASGDFQMRLGDEAWTEIHKLMSFSSNQDFSALISEVATGKKYMETNVHRKLVFGDGQLPFLLWEPTLFEPNFKLNFNLVDLSNAANTIWITAACRKVFIDPKEVQLARV